MFEVEVNLIRDLTFKIFGDTEFPYHTFGQACIVVGTEYIVLAYSHKIIPLNLENLPTSIQKMLK